MNILTHILVIIAILTIAFAIVGITECIAKDESTNAVAFTSWVGWSGFLITMYYTLLI